MTESNVTFHNLVGIRVQAQIFLGRALVSTCVADPGETCVLPAGADQYDIFFKHGTTGLELARKLGSASKTLTLSQNKGRYIVS